MHNVKGRERFQDVSNTREVLEPGSKRSLQKKYYYCHWSVRPGHTFSQGLLLRCLEILGLIFKTFATWIGHGENICIINSGE